MRLAALTPKINRSITDNINLILVSKSGAKKKFHAFVTSALGGDELLVSRSGRFD
jgi:hypothetical protein